MKINPLLVERMTTAKPDRSGISYRAPVYAPGVLPPGVKLAMDEAPNSLFGYGQQAQAAWSQGYGFMGYPWLAELTQIPEYRIPAEVMAEEMTRKWIVIKSTGDDPKTEKIKALTEAVARFKLRECFRDWSELGDFMGLAFLHIDVGTSDQPDEMKTPLKLTKQKIGKGSLRGFRVVDPTWCAPTNYQSANPLLPDFYKPLLWFVMGMQVHVSRLLPMIPRPLPDMLKPAYNFGGMSLSQMLKPYVDNWLRTRQSVSDLLNAFTIWVLETNMQAELQGGMGGVDGRIALFQGTKNNGGVLALDKEMEAFSNISAPLGTLDKLQAQTQEHMAAVARITLTKLFGITPTGLNATTEGEERAFYDSVRGRQERLYTDPLKTCLDAIQLSEFGEIDEELTAEFVPLWELDEAGAAAVQKTNADTDAVLIESGVISNEESRERVASDPKSGYHGLSGPAPEPPDDEDKPSLTDPTEQIDKQGEGGSETGANSGV